MRQPREPSRAMDAQDHPVCIQIPSNRGTELSQEGLAPFEKAPQQRLQHCLPQKAQRVSSWFIAWQSHFPDAHITWQLLS